LRASVYESVAFCRMKHVAAFLTSDSKSKKPSQVETWAATPTLQPPVRQTRSDLPRVLYNFSDHKPTGKPQRDVPTSTSTPTRPEKQSQTSPQVVRHDWRSPPTAVSDESTTTITEQKHRQKRLPTTTSTNLSSHAASDTVNLDANNIPVDNHNDYRSDVDNASTQQEGRRSTTHIQQVRRTSSLCLIQL